MKWTAKPLSVDENQPLEIEEDVPDSVIEDFLDKPLPTPARVMRSQQARMISESLATFYSDSQPRDTHGRWAPGGSSDSGGGGGGGGGKPSDCPPCPSVEDDLIAGRKTTIDGDHLDSLLTDMEEKPSTNLANLAVTGPGNENMYQTHIREIPREQMPQLPTTVDGIADFQTRLDSMGIKASLEEVDPRSLKMTQNQLDSKKVGKIAERIRSDGWQADGVMIISREGAILDGHHRWGAAASVVACCFQVKMKTLRVDVDIDTLLKIADASSGPKKGMAAAAKAQPPAPPNKNKPWIWIDGQWLLVITDSEDDVPDSLAYLDKPKPKKSS